MAFKELINDDSGFLNWAKAQDLIRYPEYPESINLDRIDKVHPAEVNANPIGVSIRDSPSDHYSVLTSYLDTKTGKWYESKKASHPFLSVHVTKINPDKNNELEGFSANLQLMADSGAMCSLLNYETVRAMGINPEKLKKSDVSITGVNGKTLKAQTRQMGARIVNNKTQTELWEKMYVHPEIQTSLLSKDCLIRLKVIDPANFLEDNEVEVNAINLVEENK